MSRCESDGVVKKKREGVVSSVDDVGGNLFPWAWVTTMTSLGSYRARTNRFVGWGCGGAFLSDARKWGKVIGPKPKVG
jgi:hypothetical protein